MKADGEDDDFDNEVMMTIEMTVMIMIIKNIFNYVFFVEIGIWHRQTVAYLIPAAW